MQRRHYLTLSIGAGLGLGIGRTKTLVAQTDPSPIIYKFGVPPWQKGQNVDDIRSRYKPMLEKLGSAVNAEFLIVGAKDYDEMSSLIAIGQVQLASISPAPFVFAERQEPGIKMLVIELSWDPKHEKKLDSYRSNIVTLKSRTELNSLADLKGKKFGFVTLKSTSGFQVPNSIMERNNIDYKTFFSKAFFLDSHPRVTDAIVSGSIDAGATWDFNLEEAIKKHGDVFKIILVSDPIPNVGIAAHPSMPEATQKKVQEALVSMDPKLLEGLSAAGYVIRPNSFYDPIRKIVDR